MKIKADKYSVETTEKENLISGNVNNIKVTFELSSDFDNLVVRAVFGNQFVTVIDNECYVPELNVGKIKVGVYGYEVEDNELKIRVSPKYTFMYVESGSYSADDVEADSPSPTELENHYQLINELVESGKLKGDTGPQGPAGADGKDGADGQDGQDGKDYILTEQDKQDISKLAKYDDAEIKGNIKNLNDSKQDKLTAGNNIEIKNNVISSTATGGSSSESGLKNTKIALKFGDNIEYDEDGNITQVNRSYDKYGKDDVTPGEVTLEVSSNLANIQFEMTNIPISKINLIPNAIQINSDSNDYIIQDLIQEIYIAINGYEISMSYIMDAAKQFFPNSVVFNEVIACGSNYDNVCYDLEIAIQLNHNMNGAELTEEEKTMFTQFFLMIFGMNGSTTELTPTNNMYLRIVFQPTPTANEELNYHTEVTNNEG